MELIRSRGARHISADQVKAAMDSLKAQPLSFMPEQMTDAFLEIAVGSEDVLSQLDGLMEAKAQKGGVTA